MRDKVRSTTISSSKETDINWPTVVFLTIFHLASVLALFFWSWPAVITAVVLYWIASSGIGMGYHRLMTHRGYKVHKGLEYFLVFCGSLALEGGPIQWATTHRIHHAHTDQVGEDPHTPRDGRWWAHIGWILARTRKLQDKSLLKTYAPDLMKQRFYVLLNRFYYVPLIMLAVALLLIGGWRVVLWGIFLRVTLGLHSTWLVNSATHLWGKQRFVTGEDSRNSWWVALLTFGEGWHNNHHAHPTSARHGLRWYEIDLNWLGIRALQFLRLARQVKTAN
jgi:stearoyl-CoA desaturase (delta-9 desaturase)